MESLDEIICLSCLFCACTPVSYKFQNCFRKYIFINTHITVKKPFIESNVTPHKPFACLLFPSYNNSRNIVAYAHDRRMHFISEKSK